MDDREDILCIRVELGVISGINIEAARAVIARELWEHLRLREYLWHREREGILVAGWLLFYPFLEAEAFF